MGPLSENEVSKNGIYLKMSAINMILKNQKDSINNFPFFGGSVDHFGKDQLISEAKFKEQICKKKTHLFMVQMITLKVASEIY